METRVTDRCGIEQIKEDVKICVRIEPVLMVPFDELTNLIHEELDNNADRHAVFHLIQRLTTKAVYAFPEEKNNG